MWRQDALVFRLEQLQSHNIDNAILAGLLHQLARGILTLSNEDLDAPSGPALRKLEAAGYVTRFSLQVGVVSWQATDRFFKELVVLSHLKPQASLPLCVNVQAATDDASKKAKESAEHIPAYAAFDILWQRGWKCLIRAKPSTVPPFRPGAEKIYCLSSRKKKVPGWLLHCLIFEQEIFSDNKVQHIPWNWIEPMRIWSSTMTSWPKTFSKLQRVRG